MHLLIYIFLYHQLIKLARVLTPSRLNGTDILLAVLLHLVDKIGLKLLN